MAKTEALTKRVAIDKTNAQMVIVVAVAAFITVFCLFASKSLLSQNSYQARVKSAKQRANNQLQQNIQAYSRLTQQYAKFISNPVNAIGGQSSGSGSSDGNNSKIILDALPSTYDFPALTTSLQKIVQSTGLQLSTITGIDEQLTEENNNSSTNPMPVPMPFSFTVTGASYQSVGLLLNTLQQSIRPIVIDSLDLTGASSDMTLTITAHTYFQPAKSLSIKNEEVK